MTKRSQEISDPVQYEASARPTRRLDAAAGWWAVAGVVYAPASTLIRAWAGSLAIALAVIVVRGFAEPWRGIVDFAVAAALSWATVVLIVSAARLLSRRSAAGVPQETPVS